MKAVKATYFIWVFGLNFESLRDLGPSAASVEWMTNWVSECRQSRTSQGWDDPVIDLSGDVMPQKWNPCRYSSGHWNRSSQSRKVIVMVFKVVYFSDTVIKIWSKAAWERKSLCRLPTPRPQPIILQAFRAGTQGSRDLKQKPWWKDLFSLTRSACFLIQPRPAWLELMLPERTMASSIINQDNFPHAWPQANLAVATLQLSFPFPTWLLFVSSL